MSKITCSEARERLQDAFDRGAPLDGVCAAHLESCGPCRAFGEFLTAYPDRLRGELERRTAEGGPTAVTRAAALGRARKKRRRIAYSLSGLAAAAVLSLGIMIAVSAVQRLQTDRYVREENSRFVDNLLNDSSFDGIAYFTAGE
jgi:anti-sigma factor RsiW